MASKNDFKKISSCFSDNFWRGISPCIWVFNLDFSEFRSFQLFSDLFWKAEWTANFSDILHWFFGTAENLTIFDWFLGWILLSSVIEVATDKVCFDSIDGALFKTRPL